MKKHMQGKHIEANEQKQDNTSDTIRTTINRYGKAKSNRKSKKSVNKR